MTKHIKADKLRPVCSPKRENWKRRQRRKALKMKIAARREFMIGWVNRGVAEARV